MVMDGDCGSGSDGDGDADCDGDCDGGGGGDGKGDGGCGGGGNDGDGDADCADVYEPAVGVYVLRCLCVYVTLSRVLCSTTVLRCPPSCTR